MSNNIEKYKELYDHSSKILFEGINRFNRIDQKATWFFSFFTLLLGLLSFFVKWLLVNSFPPSTFIDWVISIFGLTLSVLVVIIWFKLFSIHKLQNIEKPPLNDELLMFYRKHTLATIYYSMSKGMKNAHIRNTQITNKKAKILSLCYKLMIATVIILIVISIVYAIDISLTNNQGENDMSDQEYNEQLQDANDSTNNDEPDFDVDSPDFEIHTESVDPDKTK